MNLPTLSPERASIAAHYAPPGQRALAPLSIRRWRWERGGMIVLATALAGSAAAGSIAALSGLAVMMVGLLVQRVWLALRVHDWARESDEAVATLNAGDAATAVAQLEALAVRAGSHPVLHALVVYNAAVAWLALGEIDRALSLLAAAEESGWMHHARSPYRGQMLVTSAWALTLRGELTLAAERLDRARSELTGPRAGMLVAAEVAFLLRTGRPREAEQCAVAGWQLAEAVAPALNMRRLYALRGFAASQAPASPERDRIVAQLVAAASPHPDGWHSAMATHWPELRAWLDAVQLAQ